MGVIRMRVVGSYPERCSCFSSEHMIFAEKRTKNYNHFCLIKLADQRNLITQKFTQKFTQKWILYKSL